MKKKIYVDLPNRPMGGESMWARPLGGDLYQIDNIPFFAYGLNYGDVVRAVPARAGGRPRIVEVVRRNGSRTLRVLADDHAPARAAVEKATALGVGCEWASPCFAALDVPPDVDLAAVMRLLDAEAAAGVRFETCEARERGSFGAPAA